MYGLMNLKWLIMGKLNTNLEVYLSMFTITFNMGKMISLVKMTLFRLIKVLMGLTLIQPMEVDLNGLGMHVKIM